MRSKAIEQAFLASLLLLSIITSIQSMGALPGASAQNPITVQVGGQSYPASGRVFYIPDTGGPFRQFIVEGPGATAAGLPERLEVIDAYHLPPGFDVRNTASNRIRVDIPDLPSSDGRQHGYGITFAQIRDGPQLDAELADPADDDEIINIADIVFVLEPREDRPFPAISFDRPSYGPAADGTVPAGIAITDPHIECYYNYDDFDDREPVSQISAKIFMSESDKHDIILLKDKAQRNTFRTPDNFDLNQYFPGATGQFKLEYRPSDQGEDGCVFPSGFRNIVIEDNSYKTPSSVSFDRPSYTVSDRPGISSDPVMISVIDEDIAMATDTLEVVVSTQFGETTYSLQRLAGTDTFSSSNPIPADGLPLIGAFAALGSSQSATLVVTYHDDSADPSLPDAQATAFALYGDRLSFDSDRYYRNEPMMLSLQDASLNISPRAYEIISVELCTYVDPTVDPATPDLVKQPGQLIDRDIALLGESGGKNTGQFVSSYYISFVLENYEDSAVINRVVLAELDSEERQSTIKELERTLQVANASTIALARVANEDVTCGQEISAADLSGTDPMQQMVTIIPPLRPLENENILLPQIPGTGGTDIVNVHEATYPPLISVSRHTCGSFENGGDGDGDGICDAWETPTGLTIPYPEDPLDPDFTPYTLSGTCCPSTSEVDIYLELDYVNHANGPTGSDTRNYAPTSTAKTNVVNAFSAKGIDLHIQTGEDVATFATQINQLRTFGEVNDGAVNSFDDVKFAKFGTSTERNTADRIKAKWQVFHYGVFGQTQEQDSGSSGVGEVIGNDLVVSLGGPGFTYNSNDQQAGTLLHELGHNLGLHHGGPNVASNDYGINCKPNYASVMSYIRQYQTTWYAFNNLYYSDALLQDNMLPSNVLELNAVDPNEWNILRVDGGSTISVEEIAWGLDHPSDPNQRVIVDDDPVSRLTGTNWDEVDWNDNGGAFSNADNLDRNGDPNDDNIADLGIPGCTADGGATIWNVDDWSNLKFNFRANSDPDFSTGASPRGLGDEMTEQIRTDFLNAGVNYMIYYLNYTMDDESFVNSSNADNDRLALIADLEDMIESINQYDRAAALDKLFEVRELVDGTNGGNATNDVLIYGDSPPPPPPPSTITAYPDPTGPSATLSVTVEDPDLDQDSNALDEYAEEDELVEISSDRAQVGDAFVDLEETAPDSGLFMFEIELVTDALACSNDDLSSPMFQADGGSDPSLGVCPGDFISIRYEDANLNGSLATITKIVEVIGWDPVFIPDQEFYNVGDLITVEITDRDANRDSTSQDIFNIRVNSTTDSVGEVFTASETGDNSGIFVLQFETSESVESDKVAVSVGDNLTVIYEDEYPANFGVNGTDVTVFTFIAQVIGSSGSSGSGSGGTVASSPMPGGGLGGGAGGKPSDAIVVLPAGSNANQTADVRDLSKVKDFLRIVDNTAAALGADLNLAYETPHSFSIRSLDPECDASHGLPDGCMIFGNSPSVTANTGTFGIHAGNKVFTIDLIGQGDLMLSIPRDLTDNIREIKSVRTSEVFDFEVLSRNSTFTTIMVNNLPYTTRNVEFSYGEREDIITVTDLKLFSCNTLMKELLCEETMFRAGDTIFTETVAFNKDQQFGAECVVLIEVRDSSDITVLLQWEACSDTGTSIPPRGNAVVETELVLTVPGEYTVRAFVLDNLQSPRLYGTISAVNVTIV